MILTGRISQKMLTVSFMIFLRIETWDIQKFWFTKLSLYGFYGHPKSTAVAVFVLLSRTTFDPSILAELTEPFGESDFDFFTVHKGFSEAGWTWKGTGPWFERFEMSASKALGASRQISATTSCNNAWIELSRLSSLASAAIQLTAAVAFPSFIANAAQIWRVATGWRLLKRWEQYNRLLRINKLSGLVVLPSSRTFFSQGMSKFSSRDS